MNFSDSHYLILDNLDQILDDVSPLVNKLKDKEQYFKHEFKLEYEQKYYDNVYVILKQYLSVETGINMVDLDILLDEINNKCNNIIWGKLYERFKR
jgi:nanoRNase/pAp phosphatase (c-di-AMP/oligoRNAs hydrolase)